jgi:phosphatidate phosphatase PAH1
MAINPFFCGFGNKSTDANAYNKLIKPNRIYIISENSQIFVPCQK